MGYTTDFFGQFDLDKPLTKEHKEYLAKFSETRRMKRDPEKASKLPDPVRTAVGLGIGNDGAYFVGGTGFCGQDKDKSVINYNSPPLGQPGLWCQWVPSEDGESIEWNGGEKFYNYVEWIKYLIDHFLKPWRYTVNGAVQWYGEDRDDLGEITVRDNRVFTSEGMIVYTEEEEV